mmetsp:Transcript_18168/g.20974  ORF Transcript_18168/g.20974 Transcript_18168/m.20974 type:complete len:184 (-) Transcript_18168:121-672(-)
MEFSNEREETFRSTYFQPVCSELSSYIVNDGDEESRNEFSNDLIFRQAEDSDRANSPPILSRANPIGKDYEEEYSCYYEEDMSNLVTPSPYTPTFVERKDELQFSRDIPQLTSLFSEDSCDSIPCNYQIGVQLKFKGNEHFPQDTPFGQSQSCFEQQRTVSSETRISSQHVLHSSNDPIEYNG